MQKNYNYKPNFYTKYNNASKRTNFMYNKYKNKYFNPFYNRKKYFAPKPVVINFGSNFFSKKDLIEKYSKLIKNKKNKQLIFYDRIIYKKFMSKMKKFYLKKRELIFYMSILRQKKLENKHKKIIKFYTKKSNILLTKRKSRKAQVFNPSITTPFALSKLFINNSIDYFHFDSFIKVFTFYNLKKKMEKKVQSAILNRIFYRNARKNQFKTNISYTFKKKLIKIKHMSAKNNQISLKMFYYHSPRRTAILQRVIKAISKKKLYLSKKFKFNLKFYNQLISLKRKKKLFKKLFLMKTFYFEKNVIKDKILRNNLWRYLKINEDSNTNIRFLKKNEKIKNILTSRFASFFNKANNNHLKYFLIKNVINDLFDLYTRQNFFDKVYQKNFHEKLFHKKYFYRRNLWRIRKPKSSFSVQKLQTFFNFKSYTNTNFYLKSFNLINRKNSLVYRKAIHYKEMLRIERGLIFKKIPFLKRKNILKRISDNCFPWYRQKFFFAFLKSKKITLNNKKTNLLYFFPKLKYYTTFRLLKRYKKTIRLNRKFLWKKSWKKTKLNKKQYFPKLFLRRSLSRGNFKRQDSFRLLHNFRTIFLKYNYKTSKNCLTFYKKLKNHSFIENCGANFLERFLWQLERSLNILIYRSKYVPHIKISNHLVRYGFIMVNNSILNNPYTQVNMFDIVRIAKLKYFKRIFLTQFINLSKIRRRHSIPSFIETNKKILALSVYRKPKIKDFVKNKKMIVFGPDQNFYNSLPVVASLF